MFPVRPIWFQDTILKTSSSNPATKDSQMEEIIEVAKGRN